MRHVRGARDAGAFCCRECAFASRAMVWRESAGIKRIGDNVRARKAAQEKIERVKQLVSSMQAERIKKLERICKDCNAPFVQRTHKGGPEARCQQCRMVAAKALRAKFRRINKARDRALRKSGRADAIDPIKVFERDGWKCHICGVKTKKALRGTYEPLAPELEHIVSLAEGGSHTWGNVACSCRRCNSAKGSASFGQLGLNIAA